MTHAAIHTRPSKTCILALDQGTTSSRAILFDRRGVPLATAQEEFPQIFTQIFTQITRTERLPAVVGGAEVAGAGDDVGDVSIVEHDPEDIWRSQLACARRVLESSGTTAEQVAAIGITNQRETTILWDRGTGRPVAPAIVWQSRVSAAICGRLRAQGIEEDIRRRTGLLLDPYFSATKIMHLLETMPGLRSRCEAGEILFGTVDTFLIWRLTSGRVHATDVTNASRTLLFDIHRLEWSEELCSRFGVPRSMLPEVRPSSGGFGETDAAWLGAPIPITGCAGDQQAAAFGQGCVRAGDAKTTYGTGAFLLFATGQEPVVSRHGLLTTPACTLPAGQPGAAAGYFLEGSVFVAGSLIDWLRDGLGMISHAREIEPLARSVGDSGGVMLVPALAGLGAPHWDPFARGLVIGLSRATGRAHIARAALESIALSVAEVVVCMQRDAGVSLGRLRVDGGASGNDLLMQMQADILGIPVERPAVLETTSLGAAVLAGLATGFFPNQAAVDDARRVERIFEPMMEEPARTQLLARWRSGVDRCRGWARQP